LAQDRDRDSRDNRKREDKKFAPRMRRRRVCVFCAQKRSIDYKDVDFVRKFITDRGKIAPRRLSGCCAKHQRIVMREVKKARHIGLVPFVVD
jgi:small subunit ribosomal protein S18